MVMFSQVEDVAPNLQLLLLARLQLEIVRDFIRTGINVRSFAIMVELTLGPPQTQH